MNTAIYAIFIAFAISVIICPFFIPKLIKLKFGQYVRNDGPKEHLRKAGTPTMGGIMIIISLLLTTILFMSNSPDILAIILLTLGFALIGFWDDYTKIIKHRSMGLRAYQKMLAQIVIAIAFLLYYSQISTFSTAILVPFFPDLTLDLGIFYAPFILFVIVATANGSNFTDGIDGLGAGITAIVTAFLLFVAWYLNSPILPITGAALGSLLGFLMFNSYPAKVFMGDTGSLALGAFVAASAVILGIPLWLLIVGLVYVIEVLSVIIQVLYFKATKGKRFFKMAPIHHSFEVSGWHETKVVAFFYIITILLALVGYLALE
ncbi:MAG: phospho-N-acetylmuramoyl-pentapeptide-transferase [Turicibacter sp.]|nr:phospho-N-acetylmuramoyl-pentapeptide-transferase [Turicibacter sp.]